MEPAVPEIYSPKWCPGPLPVWSRLLWGVLAAACLLVLLTAATLKPSPDGLGTHEELGLHECEWLEHTGFPCPSCGMTTSWTWFAHGNLAASFYIQPMGFVLAILCVMLFWSSVYLAATGRNPSLLLRHIPMVRLGVVLLIIWAAAWMWKIYIHAHGIDGWS